MTVPAPTSGICVVRLVSGEELIGQIDIPYGSNELHIKKPAIIIVQPPRTQNEQMGIALIGWLPYTKVAKEGATFKMDHVLFVVHPDDGMVKTYKERFTSDSIVVPQPDVKRASGLVIPGSYNNRE